MGQELANGDFSCVFFYRDKVNILQVEYGSQFAQTDGALDAALHCILF